MKSLWTFYINPHRGERNSPWVWAVSHMGQTGQGQPGTGVGYGVLTSLPQKGRKGFSGAVKIHEPNYDAGMRLREKEKIDKGCECVIKLILDSPYDEEGLMLMPSIVGSYLQLGAERMVNNLAFYPDDLLKSIVVAAWKEAVDKGLNLHGPHDHLLEAGLFKHDLFMNLSKFGQSYYSFPGYAISSNIAKPNLEMIEASFVFQEGVVSPIW